MGLFDNIRAEILEEFNSYVSDNRIETKYYSNKTFNKLPGKIKKSKDDEFIFKLELNRWGYAPVCPFCNFEKCYMLLDHRYRCGNSECKKDFNVFTGTVLQNTKISLNVWHDIITEYRANKSFSTRNFGQKNNVTQKTTWFILAKLKTSPFINEPDISPMQILFTPNPFTHKTYIKKKPTFKEFQKQALKNLENTYTNSNPNYELLAQLLITVRTHFDGKLYLAAAELGLSNSAICRYFTGERKLTDRSATIINDFLKKKVFSGYSHLLNN